MRHRPTRSRLILRDFAEALLAELQLHIDESQRRPLINRAIRRYFQGRGGASKATPTAKSAENPGKVSDPGASGGDSNAES